MKRTLMAALLTAILSSTANAEGRMFIGVGIDTCREWNKEPNRKGERMTWVLGFLSGRNFREDEDRLLRKKVTAKLIEQKMNDWCKSDPTATVAFAAEMVFQNLQFVD